MVLGAIITNSVSDPQPMIGEVSLIYSPSSAVQKKGKGITGGTEHGGTDRDVPTNINTISARLLF